MVWKVYVKVFGETEYVTNGLDYPTKEKADEAGRELAGRWMLVDKWESREV